VTCQQTRLVSADTSHALIHSSTQPCSTTRFATTKGAYVGKHEPVWGVETPSRKASLPKHSADQPETATARVQGQVQCTNCNPHNTFLCFIQQNTEHMQTHKLAVHQVGVVHSKCTTTTQSHIRLLLPQSTTCCAAKVDKNTPRRTHYQLQKPKAEGLALVTYG
jgi:hypothetical protein